MSKKLSERFADLIHPCPPSKVIECGELLSGIQDLELRATFGDWAKDNAHFETFAELTEAKEQLQKLKEALTEIRAITIINVGNEELDKIRDIVDKLD